MKLDFFTIKHHVIEKRDGTYVDIYPDFLNKASDDLMIRGGKFYAVLNKDTGFWDTNEYRIQQVVDEELKKYAETDKTIQDLKASRPNGYVKINVRYMLNSRDRAWKDYRNYVNDLPDHYAQLDDRLCFDTDKVKPEDHLSKKLPYKLKRGDYSAWKELAGTLYEPKELEKIEWAIGSVIAGDSTEIQKFIVFYGEPGAGKGTILRIIQQLFQGYYEVFDAKSLGNSSNAFAFEQFRSNPLVAIQMDGDLSKIEDNSKLNSLISHETVLMNEKRKQSYSFTPRCFLFMASNKGVKMTDANSGLRRRLIDVNPSNKKVPKREYDRLLGDIGFQLGAIAQHCLEVYRKLGKNYYNGYEPTQMMILTNPIYNFLRDSYEDPQFPISLDPVPIKELYEQWIKYCELNGVINKFARYQFFGEVKPYYKTFKDRDRMPDGSQVRSVLSELKINRLYNGSYGKKDEIDNSSVLRWVLDKKESLLDIMLADCQAQYGVEKPEGGSKPENAWDYCKTKLKDLDTSQLHFVRPPKNHIVIDFDLKNEKGEKDKQLNLEAANELPPTYAEYSQGGNGIHLHYIYDGDVEELASEYKPNIEIKVFTGKASLRRRLIACNDIPVATMPSGSLPKKEVKDTVNYDIIENEEHIKHILAKCLHKKIQQPYTTPAMSLIKKTLDTAYASGITYDVSDFKNDIDNFAAGSHNQKDFCMKMANQLHYKSKDLEEAAELNVQSPNCDKPQIDIKPILDLELPNELQISKRQLRVETKAVPQSDTLVFFDIEVFPNLFLVNWKEHGVPGVAKMINPTRSEIAELCNRKLVGFNCRRYDNHILYARMNGYSIEGLYQLSQRIIKPKKNSRNSDLFPAAYDISYTDVLDFAAKKQSLKKWEIELGIHHQELGLPWDQPVPPEMWDQVAAYCDNDVIATEAVFDHLAGDFKARKILADIAGMKVNDTTNMLTAHIIFGDVKKPYGQFNYPDLTKEFPGYRFEFGKSYYRHKIKIPKKEDFYARVEILKDIYKERLIKADPEERWVEVDELIGEGGRVYAVPGIHEHVITFDVASMHPSSIIAENGFGPYTERFKQLLDIRIAIKHKDYEKARKMLDGKLAKYLDDPEQADALSQALKIAINSVYGLTAASFENQFHDPRNKDNWVAKRGALFIETLRLKVTEMGGRVVHIKTDSIKVIEPTDKITSFIMEYGKKWGYNFEVEDIYEKMCLVNDAVYIALRDKEDPGWLKECRKAKKKAEETGKPYVEPTRWSATGAQFAHPYVFKALFSHDVVTFRDLCETKSVSSDAALYLDFNENLSDVSVYEKDLDKLQKRAKALIKAENLEGTWDEYPAWRKEHPDAVDQKTGTIYEELDELVKDQEALKELIAEGHKYQFVGKAGSFCPVRPGTGGGILCRESNGKYSAATGSKGYRWREGESLEGADRMDLIDMAYFEGLAAAARESVDGYARKIGSSFEAFALENDISKSAVTSQGEQVERRPAPSSLDVWKPEDPEPPFDDESIRKAEEDLKRALQM